MIGAGTVIAGDKLMWVAGEAIPKAQNAEGRPIHVIGRFRFAHNSCGHCTEKVPAKGRGDASRRVDLRRSGFVAEA